MQKRETDPFAPHMQYPLFLPLAKDPKSTICPPSRPIVASTDSFTSGLSQYIDFFLQPIVSGLPSHIKDSGHIIGALQSYVWDNDYLWASLDVVSLYTSIPHKVGLEARQHFLSKDPNMNPRQAQFLIDATGFCLEHNYFVFQDKFYIQKHRTAMVDNFAPSYANIVMGYCEERYVWTHNPFARYIVFFGPYIDDVLVTWNGSVELFDSFVTYCNDNIFGSQFYIQSGP